MCGIVATFAYGAGAPPVDRAEVIDEDAAVRISHLQSRYLDDFAFNVEWIIDDALERLARLHRN